MTTITETIEFLKHVKQVFPAMRVNHVLAKYWHEAFRDYNSQQMKEAFKLYLKSHERAPSIASFAQYLGNPQVTQLAAQIQRQPSPVRYTEIEYCMDILGVSAVIDALQDFGSDGTVKTFYSLCCKKNWVPTYKQRISELVAFARTIEHRKKSNQFRLIGEIVMRSESSAMATAAPSVYADQQFAAIFESSST